MCLLPLLQESGVEFTFPLGGGSLPASTAAPFFPGDSEARGPKCPGGQSASSWVESLPCLWVGAFLSLELTRIGQRSTGSRGQGLMFCGSPGVIVVPQPFPPLDSWTVCTGSGRIGTVYRTPSQSTYGFLEKPTPTLQALAPQLVLNGVS